MYKIVILLVVGSLSLMACSSKVAITESNVGEISCLNGAPNWVIIGGEETGLSSIGSAVIGKAGLQYARTEALAAGRDAMSRTLSVKVNNMFKSFTQVTGIGDTATIDKVSADVSKQVSSQVITGSKQIGSWVSQCGELYILVGIDPEIAQMAVREQTYSSLQNEAALWQQFQAKNAQDELDANIQKEFRSSITYKVDE